MSTIRHTVVGALAMSVATLGDATSVRAQSSATDASAESALVSQGISLRRAGDDARALEVFQRAEQGAPDSARVQVHLAATHQALGEWEAADRYLARALEHADDPYIQKHEATLAAARHTIDGHMGSLELSGGPPGADVRLNGRSVGTLPLREPIRVAAGIYSLEVQKSGHYSVTRSVALAGGVRVRESVQLSPMASRDGAFRVEDHGTSRFRDSDVMGWTFAGLGLGAGIGTFAAWMTREDHADRWNDDEVCLLPGQTRSAVCRDERRDAERAETWMWIGAVATGTFAAASAVSFWVIGNDTPESTAGVDCGVGLSRVVCSGRF